MARVEHISPEIAELLSSTGCKYMGMGIECGNEEFRQNFLNRKMTNAQIENAFSLLMAKGILLTSFNMIGFPFDYDDMLTEETINID